MPVPHVCVMLSPNTQVTWMFPSISTTHNFFLDLCYDSYAYTSLCSEVLQSYLVYFPFLPADLSFIHFHYYFTVTLNVQLHPTSEWVSEMPDSNRISSILMETVNHYRKFQNSTLGEACAKWNCITTLLFLLAVGCQLLFILTSPKKTV
jgi:hypothetical protein